MPFTFYAVAFGVLLIVVSAFSGFPFITSVVIAGCVYLFWSVLIIE